MLCRDVMKANVVTCRESDTVKRCAELMRDFNIGFVPVVNAEGHLAGVVTDRDLVMRVVSEGRSLLTEVGTIVSREVVTVVPTDDLRDAEEKMAGAQKSRLVVTDGCGHCAGVLSLADVARADSRRRAGHVLREVTLREAAPKDDPAPTGFE